ncbi:hypothetical protein CBM2633_P30020 [Cupriavidus taiwanensis]|uniref:Uncharacterized protein n=2 Tax=Cupriavidus taiwanensis TaxID=164546 RepID=A0A976AC52_9BURK|nr:hypothetical protein pRALTA_0029 [Cupriavidus taiwanensis LMG 19424]SOY75450.1 hypothetical protein CBM2592_P30019 [Cupriavidus taiwanensis]SOY76302.1 hypothetical protein CBM2589_P30018 [Cupriavidus taiwanensis]SPA21750.1 hypothetical protein CBM2631_P40014 [Cupriavidus taiwanensis]SPA23360.1 hypothetical protein CBM2633_P30020 [Cupriavidus taiwanensis]
MDCTSAADVSIFRRSRVAFVPGMRIKLGYTDDKKSFLSFKPSKSVCQVGWRLLYAVHRTTPIGRAGNPAIRGCLQGDWAREPASQIAPTHPDWR